MDNVKITKVLGNDKYEVHVNPIESRKTPIIFGVCHDYALFSAPTSLYCEMGVSIPRGHGGSSNTLPIVSTVQMPIRAMGQIILPALNESEYLKEEHYTNRMVWGDNPICNWADSDNVHIYDKGQKKFIEISRELYKQLNP